MTGACFQTVLKVELVFLEFTEGSQKHKTNNQKRDRKQLKISWFFFLSSSPMKCAKLFGAIPAPYVAVYKL